VEQITATDAALAELARLRERFGPLTLLQSGGCCDGSSPLCVREGELLVGRPNDEYLGEVGGVSFWIDRDQWVRWNRPAFVLDVAPGAPSGFSLEGVDDVQFVSRPPPASDAS
jgi:uncharacterized protein (DUF779 family)